MTPFRRLRLPVVATLLALAVGDLPAAEPASASGTGYSTGVKTRDGLGKYYFGREIASYDA
jgi:hypothetical protein